MWQGSVKGTAGSDEPRPCYCGRGYTLLLCPHLGKGPVKYAPFRKAPNSCFINLRFCGPAQSYACYLGKAKVRSQADILPKLSHITLKLWRELSSGALWQKGR